MVLRRHAARAASAPGIPSRLNGTLEATMETVKVARTVLDGFDEAVAGMPGQIAVVCRDQSLTYEELDGRANQVAWRLRELGAGPETVVGVCLPRGPELAVAVLAVLKAGAGYLPLEPEHPDERLRAVLTASGAAALLADDRAASRLAAAGWGKPVLWPDSATAPVPPMLEAGPGNLHDVIYTSGSTGTPKGIAMQHGPQIALLDLSRQRYLPPPRP